jgi:hypothetical protein
MGLRSLNYKNSLSFEQWHFVATTVSSILAVKILPLCPQELCRTPHSLAKPRSEINPFPLSSQRNSLDTEAKIDKLLDEAIVEVSSIVG